MSLERFHREQAASRNRIAAKVEKIMTEKQLGTKHDGGKPRWSLLPRGTIPTVIAVLEYGARKYQVDNWMRVDDPERRYYDAAMRHINAWLQGENNDPESKLPHLAHAVACLLFLMWFDRQKEKTNGNP